MRDRFLTFAVSSLLLVFADAPVSAQYPTPTPGAGGLISPSNPILVDTNNNGVPDSGDSAVMLQYLTRNNTVQMDTPWYMMTSPDCMNTWYLGARQNGNTGPFIEIYRDECHHGVRQTATMTGFAGSNRPVSFGLDISLLAPAPRPLAGTPSRTGTGTGEVYDRNGDGIYDGIRGRQTSGGGSVSFDFSFAYYPDPTNPTYLSLPWGTSGGGVPTEIPGVKPLGGQFPAVFVPLYTDPNGKKAIGWDPFGSGLPNPDFPIGPPVAPNPSRGALAADVPSLTAWGFLALAAALVSAGLLQLRNRGMSFGF